MPVSTQIAKETEERYFAAVKAIRHDLTSTDEEKKERHRRAEIARYTEHAEALEMKLAEREQALARARSRDAENREKLPALRQKVEKRRKALAALEEAEKELAGLQFGGVGDAGASHDIKELTRELDLTRRSLSRLEKSGHE